MDRGLAIFYAHMHVQAKDEIGPCDELQVLYYFEIALVGVNFLGSPVRERMRRTGGEHQTVVAGEPDHIVPQLAYILLRFFDVLADASPYLYNRLMHLRLDLLFHNSLTLGDDLAVDVRTQIAGFGIDRLIFLFNTDGERRLHSKLSGAHPCLCRL